MRNFLPSLILLFLCNICYTNAYNNLVVSDPQTPWNNCTGTIEEATTSIRPHGAYMEVGLYLTFSASNCVFLDNQQLEVIMNFDLPKGAIIYDSWLWVEDEIVRADIRDRWSATQIYEDIVDRRKDPSLLTKEGDDQYLLRVYPMMGKGTRKVKIAYLVPVDWDSEQVSIPLPTNLLKQSQRPVDLKVVTWQDEYWKVPSITEFPSNTFATDNDDFFGRYTYTGVDFFDYRNIVDDIHFSLIAPIDDGFFVTYNADTHVYQLALIPSQTVDLPPPPTKRTLVLVDIANVDNTENTASLFNQVSRYLRDNAYEGDQFNVLYSELFSIEQANDNWQDITTDNVNAAFKLITENSSLDSNLPYLLNEAISFVGEEVENTQILLLSTSADFVELSEANALIDAMKEEVPAGLPFHIFNFRTSTYPSSWVNGNRYYGNDYLYQNLSSFTKGHYVYDRIQNNQKTAFNELTGLILSNTHSLEVHTDMADGFCYNRYNLHHLYTTAINSPILQVGKYNGEFPFTIELSGFYNNQPISQEFVIGEESLIPTDSLALEIWTGNYLLDLESRAYSTTNVNQIIQHSIDERVLSRYTAFLALEPAFGGEICNDCEDDSGLGGLVGFEEEAFADSLDITIYPNPFTVQSTIEITLADIGDEEVLVQIYNALGQVVKVFDPSLFQPNSTTTLQWHPEQDLPSGLYVLEISTVSGKVTKKIQYVK